MPINVDIPSTIICQVVDAPTAGGSAGSVSYRGQIIKARVLDETLSPSEGDTVLGDYLRTAKEIIITTVAS